MPTDNESPRPSAQPAFPPDPGKLMTLMMEVPETLMLVYQQFVAGAPTAPLAGGPPGPWELPWRQAGARPSGPPRGATATGSPPDRSEPPHVLDLWLHLDVADFWRRSLRSFRNGLAGPSGDRRS
jgi:hypothetical protein